MIRVALFVLALALPGVAAAAPQAAPTGQHHEESTPAENLGYVEGAQALESRLLAPCCWNQTLDIHGSEVSTDLKREIRRRLRAGESADAIETSIVARYGEKIRAVPKGSPLGKTAALLAILMGVGGVGAAFMLLRWRRRSATLALAEKSPAPSASKGRDRYDEQIDAELDRM
jgi:cytochrome c-type biogenesis protein CcmH